MFYQEIQIEIGLWPTISNSVNFFESLNVALINMVTILMLPTKVANLGFFKIKVFWNKGYDVKVFVHDLTTKILLHDLNDIVDAAIWSKFGNSSISMKGVTITSTL